MERYAGILTDYTAATFFSVLAISVVLLASKLLPGNGKLNNFPLNGKELGSYPKRLMYFVYNAEKMYRQGYDKFKNAIWRITTVDGERINIPNKYLDEIRQLTDDEISMQKALYMNLEGRYTGLEADSPFLTHVVRADLTRNLPRVNPRLCLEVDKAVKTELPSCEDWTPVCMNQHILRIVAIVSGHIFLGPELCRREEYLHASINYTVDVFAAVRALKKWPRFLRPIKKYFTPELRGIIEHKEKAQAFLVPIIRERKQLMKEEKELPDDMLQWMLNKADDRGIKDDAELAYLQLALSMAAIHTTSMTCTHVLYDLVAHPDIIPELRKEIQTVLKESDGVFTTQALFHMKLLDSVMRESQRVNPLGMTRFSRYIQKPVTLQDGTQLPARVVLEIPHIAINHDPSFYPNPDTFEPYRFYQLRNGETPDPIGYKSTEQYQFVVTDSHNMGFGYGRHACPGRFFAANEIKLILARMILDFDMKMPEGQTKRFDNLALGGNLIPDVKKEILMCRVKV